jgi:DNA-directed RNA polymerase specialized sigma24 family protein
MIHAGEDKFPTTDWTLVSRMRSRDSAIVRKALGELYEQYRYALYCYIRRRGLNHHDAQDALHDFLRKLVHLDAFADLRQEIGRLRGFLCTALRRFIASWFESRKHDHLYVSISQNPDMTGEEERFQHEKLTDSETPEHIFERKWAHEMLRRVLRRLRQVYAAKDRLALFDALCPCLMDDGTLRGDDTACIAGKFGMSKGNVRVCMTRLRDDFREELRGEVAQTVEGEDQIDAELAYLRSVFQRRT